MAGEDFTFHQGNRAAPRAPGHPMPAQQPQPGQHAPRIQVPSFSQMMAGPPQAAPTTMNDMFRPRGLQFNNTTAQQTGAGPSGASAGPSHTGAPQYNTAYHMPPTQGNPAPRLQGAPPPGYAPPTYHQQHQQYQPQQPQQYQPQQAAQQPQQQYQPQQAQQGQPFQGPAAQGVGPGMASGNAILVSKRQQGNPILKHIRNVRWTYADVMPDYVLGANACALFLSLRYHLLHPSYLLYRIKELQRAWALRVVLCHVDTDDPVHALAEVTKTAALNECTLICAWSAEEAARYLETFKAYENKPSSGIQERVEGDYASRLASVLTAVRAVNRTDALALGAQFGTLADIMRATPQQLSACPGIGPTKVQNLWDTFHKPFRKTADAADVSQQGVGQGVGRQASGATGASGGAATAGQGSGAGQSVQDAQGSDQMAAAAVQRQASTASVQQPAQHASVQNAPAAAAAASRPGAQTHDNIHAAGQNGALHGNNSAYGIVSDGVEHHNDVVSVSSDDGGLVSEEEDAEGGSGLVHMASQIMLQVQAGAMAAELSEEEGSQNEEQDWQLEAEEL